MKISKFIVIKGLVFPYSGFSKGHNSVKNIRRVMVLVLCISSDDALYFLQSFMKMSQRVYQLFSGQDFQYLNFQRGIIP